MLALYSDDPSSNPAEDTNFIALNLLEKDEINEKETEIGPFKKSFQPHFCNLQVRKEQKKAFKIYIRLWQSVETAV